MEYEYRFFTHSISAHGVDRLDKAPPVADGWEPVSLTSTYAARAEDVVVVVLARRERQEPAPRTRSSETSPEWPTRS
jgi:hypothetical protein